MTGRQTLTHRPLFWYRSTSTGAALFDFVLDKIEVRIWLLSKLLLRQDGARFYSTSVHTKQTRPQFDQKGSLHAWIFVLDKSCPGQKTRRLPQRFVSELRFYIGPIVQCILNSVHLKLKFTPLLLRFQQNNIRAKLDKLVLRNRGVGQNKNSGPLSMGG